MPGVLCAVSSKHSTLIWSMMVRIPRFVISGITVSFSFALLKPLSSEKCRTVMHEAIVAQLHPQDQRFLSGSAVSLHQKKTERERGRMQWKNETDFKQKGDRVNESRGGKAKENETK